MWFLRNLSIKVLEARGGIYFPQVVRRQHLASGPDCQQARRHSLSSLRTGRIYEAVEDDSVDVAAGVGREEQMQGPQGKLRDRDDVDSADLKSRSRRRRDGIVCPDIAVGSDRWNDIHCRQLALDNKLTRLLYVGNPGCMGKSFR